MGRNKVFWTSGLDCIPYFIVLLIPVTLAVDHLSVKVTNFNSSFVEYDCQYHGNEKNISFQVTYNEYVCLSQNDDGQCTFSLKNGCRVKCKESHDSHQLNVVSFRVDLNSTCENDLAYRCTARNNKLESQLHLERWFKILDGISDPPKISINNGKPVELDGTPMPIPIECTVTNACYRRKVEISADVHLKPLSHSFTEKEKERYTAMARTTALFDKFGNYTLSCRDTGLNKQYSKFATVAVRKKQSVDSCANKLDSLPSILINRNNTIELDGKPVSVECTFEDTCKKIDVEISGNIHVIMPLTVSYQNTETGFKTTASTTALFVKAGKYHISCRESGKKGNVADLRFSVIGEDLTSVKTNLTTFISIGIVILFVLKDGWRKEGKSTRSGLHSRALESESKSRVRVLDSGVLGWRGNQSRSRSWYQ